MASPKGRVQSVVYLRQIGIGKKPDAPPRCRKYTDKLGGGQWEAEDQQGEREGAGGVFQCLAGRP